jgi:hypothetical protein
MFFYLKNIVIKLTSKLRFPRRKDLPFLGSASCIQQGGFTMHKIGAVLEQQ